MLVRRAGLSALLVAIVACGGADEAVPDGGAEGDSPGVASAGQTAAGGQTAGACVPSDRMDVEGRSSPYDSVTVSVGGFEAKVCYGRPSMRGREVFGALVPYDTIWRTGANEPTIIHLPVAAEIAGIAVEPGSYSLYTVPGQQEWTVIVNQSTTQWGIESQYTDDIRAEEVGRAQVPSEPVADPVEMFTITAGSSTADSSELVLEWERTRVRIPIEATG